jgi:hypothetical protein
MWHLTTKCHMGPPTAWHFTTKCHVIIKEVQFLHKPLRYCVTKCYISYGGGTVKYRMSHLGTCCIKNVTFHNKKFLTFPDISWHFGKCHIPNLGRSEMPPPDVMKCHIRHFKCHIRHFKCHIRHSCVTTWPARWPDIRRTFADIRISGQMSHLVTADIPV